MANNKVAEMVSMMRKAGGATAGTGLKIVRVNTAAPKPVTFIFEGTKLAIDIDIFEVPASAYPLTKGDRFFALPIIGNGDNQRWGLITKL